jgi:TolA-binding protein
LLDNKVYDKAREQLQGIIDAYPKTAAAKKARVMLGQIPSQ